MIEDQLSRFTGIMREIDCVYEDYAKSAGLTFMSLSVLSALYRAPSPLSQRDLCEQCRFGKQSVGAIIASFRGEGYLTLEGDPGDRRSKRIVLTGAGRAFAQSVIAPLACMESSALSVLTEGERDLMLQMMERCRDGYVRALAAGLPSDRAL